MMFPHALPGHRTIAPCQSWNLFPRVVAHPLCAFLWEGQTRLAGYYDLGPKDKDADLGVEVYRKMGALPTLICNDPAQLTADQPLVKRVLSLIPSK